MDTAQVQPESAPEKVALAKSTRTVQQYRVRDGYLRSQATPFFEHWREIAQHILPRARFMPFETNRGDKKYLSIVNNVGSLALRSSVAGLVAGLTSPVRPWHHLTTPDPDLAEVEGVRGWLHLVEERQRSVFAKSNLYQALAAFYYDLLAYGTALIIIDEDEETILRVYHVPAGSYRLACSEKGRPDTVFRDLTFAVRQLVQKFHYENCSERVQKLYDQGQFDVPIDVVHVIEPNEDYLPGRLNNKQKRFRSCWFENPGGSSGAQLGEPETMSAGMAGDKFLLESGFQEQRALAARWMVIGEDTYGSNAPGMEALGDCKALTAYEKEQARSVEMLSGPPLAVPNGMGHVSLQPRKITPLPQAAGNQQVRPMIDVAHLPQGITALRESRGEIVQRVNRTLYADLWQMLTLGDQTGGVQPKTAEEIRARLEEKLVQVAPMLLRLDDELLRPLVDVSFALMWRAGLIPEPPQELAGVDIKVEFISMLHTAQQFVQLGGIERLGTFVAMLMKMGATTALDKLNIYEMVDEYAKTLGLPPKMVRTDDEVAQIAAQRKKQAQAEALAHATQIGADAVQKLGNTPMSEDSALSRLSGLTGPVEPTGVTGTQPGAQA